MPYSNVTFTVSQNLSYVAGDIVQLSTPTNTNAYIIGTVVSYNSTSGVLVVTPTTSVGSGTYNDWIVNLSGEAGSAGTSGTSASAGSSGTSGTSGTSGSDGLSGSNGSNGTSATSGTSGSSGTSATSGSSGLSDISGSSGTSGTSASSGTAGYNGTSGASASSGTNGSSGTAASSGTNGSAGTSGVSAVSGVNGGAGPTGPTGPGGPTGPTGSISPNNLSYGSAVAFNNCTVGNNWFFTGYLRANALNQGCVNAGTNASFVGNGTNWISSGGVGSPNFFSTSTKMVKTNISPYGGSGLEIINETKIVSFNFELDGQDDQTHIGFIAEDTREEIATPTKDRQDINSSIGVLLKAVQEIDTKLKILENK